MFIIYLQTLATRTPVCLSSMNAIWNLTVLDESHKRLPRLRRAAKQVRIGSTAKVYSD